MGNEGTMKPNKHWSFEEDEILKKYMAEGLSCLDISKLYLSHRTAKALLHRVGKLGLTQPAERWTEDEDEKLRCFYKTLSCKQLQEKFFPDRTVSGISHRLHRLKLAKPGRMFYDVDHAFFSSPNILNSYWAGFLASDGNVSVKNNRISFKLKSTDVDCLERFKSDIKYNGPIHYYEGVNAQTKNVYKYNHLQICSSAWKTDLATWFNITPQKTFTLVPPGLQDDKLKDSFVAGLIAGDGCISKQKYTRNKKTYEYLSLRITGTEPILKWVMTHFQNILDFYHFDIKVEHFKLTSAGKSGKIFTVGVTGKPAEFLISHFQQYKDQIPLMQRKFFRYGVI